jgi:hypothetical protein
MLTNPPGARSQGRFAFALRSRIQTLRIRPFWLAISLLIAAMPSLQAQEPAEPLEQRVERLEAQVAELRSLLDAGADSVQLEEVRRQLDAITRELETLRLGEGITASADTIGWGLGPAASKVYRVGEGVSIGGYGEFQYVNPASTREDGSPSGSRATIDALRGVVYVGYKFSDAFLFNSEIEFEHGSTGEEGSVSLEFAYLDWRFGGLQGSAGLRGGLLLHPMGFINEIHEPPTYLGALRPETEQRIIPTTWRELGLGVFGTAGDFDWRLYAVTGLDGTGFDDGGLRGGRQKGSKAVAEDFAAVGRVDWLGAPGLVVGASGYYGGSGQGIEDPLDPGETVGAATFIAEGHVEYRARGVDVRGLFAVSTVDDAASLNAVNGFSGVESIGERLVGWYVQAGYDVLRSARTQVQLKPYVRYEAINTQDEVPDGFAADPANDQQLVTLGAQVLPIPNIAAKVDYTIRSNGADRGVNGLNVSLSYMF